MGDGPFFVTAQFGCPAGSPNQRPETLIVIPERSGMDFDYMEYTNPFASQVDGGSANQVIGHATRK